MTKEHKFDILFSLLHMDLKHVIFDIFSQLSAKDLKNCQLVSKLWFGIVDQIVYFKLEKKIMGHIWERGDPGKTVLMCEKARSVCTVSSLSADCDGICVGLGSSGDLEYWNRQNNQRIWRCHAHDDGVYGVDMNADLIVSCGDDGLVKIYRRTTGEELKCYDHHKYIVWTTSLWMNRLFTASYDCSVAYMTFDMLNETFSQPNIIEGPEDWVNAFGSDAQAAFLATHDDESHDIRIWNISTLNIKTTLVGHTDDVHCIKFVRKEQLICTGGADKSVRLWDMTDGQCLRTLTGHEGIVWCLDINRHRIVAGGRYGEIRVWNRHYDPEFARSLWLHPRDTSIGRIRLEATQLITTDGLGAIAISDFWQTPMLNMSCGCKAV